MSPARALPLALLTSALAACAGAPAPADLGAIYDRAARLDDRFRNPVVVIPGILGSKLRDGPSGRVVWGAFSGESADPETPDGARLLALPMADGEPLERLRDDVRPDGALDRLEVDVLGLPFLLEAYAQILGALGVGGYRDEQLAQAGAVSYGDDHFTCFQFAYDWRRDNAENARLLHEFIRERKAYVEAELTRRYGPLERPVKFDIVAHSMGGLVTRYFLQYGSAPLPDDGSLPELTWAGADLVERVVIVGTPNAGSAKAITQLVDGVTFAPILPFYEPAVLGTMPAVYELLPRSRHGPLVEEGSGRRVDDLLDPALWEQLGWGLAAPGQDRVLAMLLPDVPDAAGRRRIALDHLRKCLARARAFHAALDRPAEPPSGLSLCLVAGDAIPTDAVIAVDRRTGRVRVASQASGDETVLRSSALMDERLDGDWGPRLRSPIAWSRVQFVFSDHLGLTTDPAFTDNVLYLLLEDPR